MSNIPELRFKEFSGEWEEKKFGDIFERVTTKNKENNLNVLTISAQQGLISQEEYFNKSVSAKDVTGYYLLHKNDFAYNKSYSNGYPMGAIKRLSKYDKGVVSTLYICFKSKKDNVIFLEKYFDTTKWYKEVHKIAQEGVRNHGLLNISVVEFFRDVKIIIPKKTEQQKIASFLTIIDTKIEQLSKKVKLQEQYKKGVMQKIFSGEIRFKKDDGSEFPEWEEKRLGDIGEFKSGTGFTELEQGGNEGIPFFKVSDMNIKENQKYMIKANNYVNEEQILRLRYKPINKISIIFAKVGAAIFLERKRIAKKFLIDNNMMSFTPSENINFIKQWLDTVRLSKYAQTGALPSYNASDLKIIKINLPHEDEQIKIANFLSTLDKQIDSTKKQLAKTKEFKKGLLQRMFV